MPETFWLAGAAPAFDRDVVTWLQRRDVDVRVVTPEPRPRWTIPLATRRWRVASYQAKWAGSPGAVLVLPYLAGDTLLLAGSVGVRTLGVALGTDVLRRQRTARSEQVFRRSLADLSAIWAVSSDLAAEVERCGRAPDWIAAVGVDLAALPAPRSVPQVAEGRILSARREAPVYRRPMIRQAITGVPALTLVETDDWPRDRLLLEMLKADVVVSLPETDGAPATIMEALCLGAHVVASGGPTVRNWLEALGGTYGEPTAVEEARALISMGRDRALRESARERLARADAARKAFDRDRLLLPLLTWIHQQPGNRRSSGSE